VFSKKTLAIFLIQIFKCLHNKQFVGENRIHERGGGIHMNQEPVQPAGKYDPEMLKQLKKEIVQEIEARREWQEDYYGSIDYGSYPRGVGYCAGYGRGWRRPMDGRYAYPPPRPMYYRRPIEVDYDWWTDRELYDYQRNAAMIRNQLRDELIALDKMNRRIGQVRDPQVQQILVELLQEARQQGLSVPDLIQHLSMNNPPGVTGTLLERVTGPLKGIDRRSFGWGMGAAILGLMLLPSLGKSIRSLTGKALEGTMDISERAQGIFDLAKEEFEDIMAEAKFNKIKESVTNEMEINGKNQPPNKK